MPILHAEVERGLPEVRARCETGLGTVRTPALTPARMKRMHPPWAGITAAFRELCILQHER